MPSVNQLKRVIANSNPGDWARWETEWSRVDAGESSGLMAVYRPDPRLRIELGGMRDDDVEEDWSKAYASPTGNRRFSVWVMFTESPIDRLDVVAVDGYRAWISDPHRPGREGEPWTLSPYENMIGVALSPDLEEYLSLVALADLEVRGRR